jgi:polyisoprenoid-binding protein YceI
MKKFFFMQLYLLMCAIAFSQYKPAQNISAVKFHVRNFGIRIDGMFRTLNGTVTFNINHPLEGKFNVSVDASSINTDNELRDSHLRGEAYFDVKNFPVISFVSREITSGEKPGTFTMSGDLTIKGHSKTISFPFMYSTENDKVKFTGSFNIDRKDFNIGGTSVISDSVGVDLNVVVEK